jgi:pre-rRNA-processing protein TSR4
MAAVVHAEAGGLGENGCSSADEPVELGFLEAVDEDEDGEGRDAVMHEDGNWLRWSDGVAGGASPAWLYPFAPERMSQRLTCTGCGRAMSFFLQVYAPLDGAAFAHAFHRTLFLFMCRQCPERAVCLRGQLARDNAFYAAACRDEDEHVACKFDRSATLPQLALGRAFPRMSIVTEPEPRADSGRCALCKRPASKRCGQCKSAVYCCREHQTEDWPKHKKLCKMLKEAIAKAESGEADEDDADEADAGEDEDEDESGKAGGANKGTAKPGAKPDSEFTQDDIHDVIAGGDQAARARLKKDPMFDSFQERVSREPEQCLRYCRWPEEQEHAAAPEASLATAASAATGVAAKVDDDDERHAQEKTRGPLWLSSSNQMRDPPACERCGAARKFELQILPQTLHFLKELESDFGTVVIYTCTRSCALPDREYAQEACHFQQAHY